MEILQYIFHWPICCEAYDDEILSNASAHTKNRLPDDKFPLFSFTANILRSLCVSKVDIAKWSICDLFYFIFWADGKHRWLADPFTSHLYVQRWSKCWFFLNIRKRSLITTYALTPEGMLSESVFFIDFEKFRHTKVWYKNRISLRT